MKGALKRILMPFCEAQAAQWSDRRMPGPRRPAGCGSLQGLKLVLIDSSNFESSCRHLFRVARAASSEHASSAGASGTASAGVVTSDHV
jgi:hypothetical protein